MRAINHALTGAIIGLTVAEPAIALPAAIASHFVLDAIPHYDGVPAKASSQAKKRWLRSRTFRRLLYADSLLCFLLITVLAGQKPVHWLLAAVCAFAAAAPDFLWIPKYLHRNQEQAQKPTGLNKFASAIQWFQRPIGAVVEVAWFAGAIILLAPLLK